MANYNLVINSQFKPFSYSEMLQPVLMATQAHQELENQYGELATKASVWEEMANEQTDPYAYKMYKTYSNNLEKQAGQLAREGLNAASRRDMLNMRARYSKEITPIEQAYTTRQKQAEQQQQARLQDPTLMLSRRASTTSLDDYIRNPQLAYESYSGKLITAQVASAAAALAKEMQGEPRKWRSILGNSYYESMMQKGVPSDMISRFLNNADSIIYDGANPEQFGVPVEVSNKLRGLLEAPLASTNIRSWKSGMSKADWEDIVTQVNSHARQGLWSAVGETQYQVLDNWRAKMDAQEAMQKRAEKRAAARQAPDTPKGFALNPSNVYSSRELSKDEKKYKQAMEGYSKYFYKDSHGQMRMNYAGWKEYNRKNKGTIAGEVMTTPEGTTIRVADAHNGEAPSAFRQFMDSIGAHKVTKGKWQPGNLGNVWSRYAKDSPAARTAKYDATKTSEYIYDADQSPEYQRNYKAKLSRAIGSDEEFKEVDYNPKTNKWEYTGNTLSFADFDTDDYTLVSRAPSEVGNTLFIKKKGEKARRYETLPGINSTAEGARDEVIAQKLSTQKMLQNPKLSPTKRVKLENYYDDLNQQQIMFESQIDVVNSTKNQEFSPYYIP